ncbi:MAG: 23S rRNA (adenine(2030)-N(6))-methyltransferase RlmJ [Hoeflea sp.]|uniref:23S rRNA (adenine(2030)-N(6))-methyltransferase RlmJ n=1 Tax=Hoeflea sp. TaxID=1940281 RepID=UPI001D8A7FB8|nr:23S rRNA (adenine(2030)-N(6))-methyltransferase RlmJ [Hoeflea sp.]MBU4530080.1 23S rRNA (adenine(2030)-N(6))-methyltransferase RlmJ [Alphaproteobacteria bacterium]MBU4542635.1 23S rRNA (adenine(2030)-N(6))-methyltransferase RlmJ [Alphaproteobacteria bacterium]MBU4551316.1 23S rRNA (adenine(2030)-N(6))-methyltransferase RlmJ [Alphaproteobacteria bacterium]MBV1723139.1 23S rRNA (adenine(2030)-N(6))-methyltransferase RlmJ [Hoeflea sp.]MBV1760150.1 23S rRNA (adenine(2030)-N(6))-methyltransferas
MNYRHSYHAGNYADVLKHAVLAQIITYLKRKDPAFRVIDTHAGIGAYDLSSAEAQKTGEWREGVGRVMAAQLSPDLAAFLAPWLDTVKTLNPDGGIKNYPGSPQLTRLLLRKQDRLTAIELHPDDAKQLRRVFEGDFQVRVIELDGWLALGGHLPPKEKRGLVLIDPPFEADGEYDRLIDGLARATRRFPGGTYVLWHPIKADSPLASFDKKLIALNRPRTLSVRMLARANTNAPGLNGSGLVIINPPFTLEAELKAVLPELARLLAQGPGAGPDIRMLVGES